MRFPELTLPEGFRHDELHEWVERIPVARLRTIVARGVEGALASATSTVG